MIGGYKIIDFEGYPVTLGGDAVTIPGIFDAINTSKKATLVENLTILVGGSSIPLRPFFADFLLTEGDFNAMIFGGQAILTITDEDAVALVAAE